LGLAHNLNDLTAYTYRNAVWADASLGSAWETVGPIQHHLPLFGQTSWIGWKR